MREDEEHLAEIEDATILKEMDRAYLVEVDDKQVIIPKSQVKEGSITGIGECGKLIIPQWLAEDRGLV